ncbi:MAG: head GIN domain-containing protein [Candidatus Zixiibacteriota bacterium]
MSAKFIINDKQVENPFLKIIFSIFGILIAIGIVVLLAVFLLPALGIVLSFVIGIVLAIIILLLLIVPFIMFGNMVRDFFTGEPKDRFIGSGIADIRKFDIDDFDKIIVSGQMDVYINQRKRIQLIADADDNIIDKIEIKQSKKEIQISLDDRYKPQNPVRIDITVTNLSKIEHKGTGAILTESKINGKNLSIVLKGSTFCELNVDYDEIKTDASGKSIVELEGKAQKFLIEARGESKFKCFGLDVDKCFIKSSGSSNIELKANDKIEIESSENLVLRYKGEPEIVKNKSIDAKIIKVE